MGATDAVLTDLRQRVQAGEIDGPEALLSALKSDLVSMLSPGSSTGPLGFRGADGTGDGAGADDWGGSDGDRGDRGDRPVDVWLFVGVNGVGKTTTLGKVANRMRAEGTPVLLAAGDTFRAAAADQLAAWASRVDADIVRGSEGGDPERGHLRRCPTRRLEGAFGRARRHGRPPA